MPPISSTAPDVLSIDSYVHDGPKIVVWPAEHRGRGEIHAHSFCEIVYIADGFTLHQSCGKITMLITGDFFFVKPGEVHSYINAYQTKLYNLLFEPSALGDSLSALASLPGLDDMLSDSADTSLLSNTMQSADTSRIADTSHRLLHISIGERRSFETAFEKMIAEREEKSIGWEISLKTRLTSLLIKYARMYADQHASEREGTHKRSDNDYYGYIYKLLCHIDRNYAKDLSMADLSEVTGLSPDYMTRKFKAMLGMTPVEYLRKFRIAKAMELLCTTDMTVSEISDSVGFSDVSLFSRVFKQNVGLPPASYRKNTSE
jgi:AraC-like DNA-binding protein